MSIALKEQFLAKHGKPDRNQALSNSIYTCLRRGSVYVPGTSAARNAEFRGWLLEEIRDRGTAYYSPVGDASHIVRIKNLCASVPERFWPSLRGGELRFGTAQMALNLWLKYLWCMHRIGEPPHCPLNWRALSAAKIYGAWTKLDSAEEYKGWIDQCRIAAGDLSLAEWELALSVREKGSVYVGQEKR